MKLSVKAVGLSILLIGCGDGNRSEPEYASPRSAGTIRMAERLRVLAESANPMLDEQLNMARLRLFNDQEPPPVPEAMILRQGAIAQEMMNAGLTGPAIEQFLLIRQILIDAQAEPMPGFRRSLDEYIGIALFRRGLELACPTDRLRRTRSSDLIRAYPCWPEVPPSVPRPVSDSARVVLERGVIWQGALLEEDPENLRAKWILNLTIMALGEWPDRVHGDFRVPRLSLTGSGELERFRDIATEVGLDAVSISGGGIVDDFNGDGFLDVMVSSRGLFDQLRYFESDGSERFVERTSQVGLEGLVGGLNIVQADYDNDDDLDVLILRGGWLVQGFPNSLLRNDGGTFTDVTHEAGVYSEHPTQTGSWADFDGDGWLDLFIGNESRDGDMHRSELFRNKGDGTFEEVADLVGLDIAQFVKGVDWGDYDNDGRPDLYVSVLRGSNLLFHNAGEDTGGNWHFDNVTEKAGVSGPFHSFPTWFWDFDNDGYLDLFAAGYQAQTADIVREYMGEKHGAELPRLYRNLADGTFEDVTVPSGLDRIMYAMGSNFGDLDNDGWLDLFVGTGDPDFRQLMPNRMFRNASGHFEEVTGAGGFGALDKGHGVSFADIDNDGDADVHIVLGGANEGDLSPNALYENPGSGHHFIVLTLVGQKANRSGIGARISITVEDGEGVWTIHRVVGTGGSFGANPVRQEIGLGRALRVINVEIRWPGSGTVDLLHGLELDRAYQVQEGTGRATSMERVSMRLGR